MKPELIGTANDLDSSKMILLLERWMRKGKIDISRTADFLDLDTTSSLDRPAETNKKKVIKGSYYTPGNRAKIFLTANFRRLITGIIFDLLRIVNKLLRVLT